MARKSLQDRFPMIKGISSTDHRTTEITRHTPGPWSFKVWMTNEEDTKQQQALGLEPVRALTNEGQRFIMAPDKRVALVDCQTDFKRGTGYQTDCAERDANAQLIAASPQMLDALERAYLYKTDMPPEVREAVQAAIAAAKGHS